MRWYSLLGVLTLLTVCPIPEAAAVPVTFSGIDSNLASTSAPRPSSEAAIAGFQAHLGGLGQSISTNGLETLPVGELFNGAPLDIGGGVVMTLGNTSSLLSGGNTFITGIRTTTSAATAMFPQFGFNTTAGGSQFLRVVTRSPAGQTTHSTVTFDFAAPIDAFGLSLTGLGSGDGSLVTLQFVDGTLQTLPIPGASLDATDIAAVFFGFVDADALISSVVVDVQFTNPRTSSSGYLLGLDDITFSTPVPGPTAVPEPTSLILLVTGLAGMAWRRRRVQQHPGRTR